MNEAFWLNALYTTCCFWLIVWMLYNPEANGNTEEYLTIDPSKAFYAPKDKKFIRALKRGETFSVDNEKNILAELSDGNGHEYYAILVTKEEWDIILEKGIITIDSKKEG